MPNKYQLINEMARETLKDITSKPEEWIKFLDTASSNYKYDFNEQVLIYAQKPDATACAEIEVWNKRLKRWVTKGAKGIALISLQDGRNIIRHVFDILDTYSGINKELKLWEVKESYHNGLIETLENNFGNLVIKNNLGEAIYSATQNLVEDNLNDYLKELKEVVKYSSLKDLEENEVDGAFITLLTNSITYMVMKRCGLDPSEEFNVESFNQITSFDTRQVVSRLGAAISDIAEQELREIYSTVINIEKSINNKNYTFVKNNNREYHESKERRSDDYDRNNIQTNGRLSSTTSGITKNEEPTTREILKNEVSISERTQKRTLHRANDGWQNGRTFRRNRANISNKSETNNQTISREIQSERRNESKQSNGMGRADEFNQSSSRGDSNAGTNLQLNLFSDSYVPPIKELPSVAEQIENIETQAEVENTPAFSFTQEMIDKALQDGTGHQNGKFRVYRLYQETFSSKERQDFLKKEFNYYGTNGVTGLDGIWVEYSPSKGLKLSKRDVEDTMQVNWNTIEKRVGELISLDRYFTNDEKEQYQNWLENDYENEKWMFNQVFKDANTNEDEEIELQNIDKNYKLKNGNYFHFHTNEEGYYYAIYDKFGFEQDCGLLEYSENEENETLMSIRKRLAEFTYIDELTDNNLQEVSQDDMDYITSGQKVEDVAEEIKQVVINNAIDAVNELKEDKPEFEIGQIIYLENERKYRVEAFNREYDQIVLMDMTMYEQAHYPMTRNESYLRALNLYKNNPRNFAEEIIEEPVVETEPKIKQDKINYHIDNNSLGEGTPKEKVRRNIEAIKLLRELEDDKRLANQEEQEILSQYVGWGGLPDVFDEKKDNWSQEYNELKSLLTPEEYNSARASTLTSFYTPPIVINAIYKAIQNMGAEEVNILEPSCGTGNFLGMLPQEMQKSKLYGVELDSISGRIAKQLYQNANIKVQGYEKADLPDSFYDVAIGNVPFGDFKVNDKRYDKNNFIIHDYFFAKTLDKVRPGGVIAFITSKGTMDKANPEVRKYIAQRADLLGAIRLPDNTFTKNAGTRVTSDIIFLQKRENLRDTNMPSWIYLNVDKNEITMNNYFIDNPEMVLGRMEMESTQYGFDFSCKAIEGQNLEDRLNKAIANIHGEIKPISIENEIETEDTSIPATPDVKNFSYAIVDNKLYFRENSRMILQDDLPLTNQNRIRGLIALREQVRELIDFQMNDYSDGDIYLAQAKLNQLYDKFTKEYGLINSRANENAFSNDSSYFLLCSLEKLDGEGKFIGKADMFTKRTIKAKKEVKEVDTSDEALILSIQEKAKVDLDYMSELTGKDKETIINELKGVIFKVPIEEIYVTADVDLCQVFRHMRI